MKTQEQIDWEMDKEAYELMSDSDKAYQDGLGQ